MLIAFQKRYPQKANRQQHNVIKGCQIPEKQNKSFKPAF
jgi:hypothetical protein